MLKGGGLSFFSIFIAPICTKAVTLLCKKGVFSQNQVIFYKKRAVFTTYIEIFSKSRYDIEKANTKNQ